jgi:diguanylate cyclase (GGDEF)-like protein
MEGAPEQRPVVLIVDDQTENVSALAAILADMVDTHYAMSGEQALSILAIRPIDLVLLDILLPGIDGFDVCRRMKADARLSHIPVIFVSGLTEPDEEERGFELGAVDYIHKPFLPTVVRARVRTHLRLLAALRELDALARTDRLTGLANRRDLLERAEIEMERAKRLDLPLALALIDLDHFKAINDRHGHNVGDRVLVEFAARLKPLTRKFELLARWGGEEFVLLLPSAGAIEARSVTERLRQAVVAQPFAGVGEVSFSAGVAAYAGEANFGDWLERADQALYRAKSEGRNRICVAAEGRATAAAVPVLPANLSPHARLQGLRVLLAEDEPINQQIARELLDAVGVKTAIVGNGRDAVIALELEPEGFDAVLMDVNMPAMDGIDATRHIRKRAPRLPIIAMTALAPEEARQRCLDAGMNAYLRKPVVPEDLYAALTRWTRSSTAVPPPLAPPSVALREHIELPGIDRAQAKRYLGGIPGLFEDLLLEFARKHAHAPDDIGAQLAAGEREAARKAAHALKSPAATLGARRLADAAKALEKTLAQTERDPAGELDEFRAAMAEVVSSAQRLSAASEGGGRMGDGGERPRPSSWRDLLLHKMLAELHSRDLSLLSDFGGLESLLGAYLTSTEIAQVKEALERADYTRADELIRARLR